jgi:glycine reductase
MVRELERLGLPTAMISPLSSVALSVGANRIIRGTAITHPAGEPTRPPEREREFRLSLVRQALGTLQMRLEAARVFEPTAA